MSLNLFAFFHLNMMFSSIPEERRPEVVEKAYWPLLDLPEAVGFPIGIEATGLTLEIINAIDPGWIARLRERIISGQIEFIGSGYAQIIGPLCPAIVNEQNLRLGNQVYEAILGARPKLALINEQAYSAGLIPLYRAAGYQAICMDWDNLAPHHPEWPAETRFSPQQAIAPDGTTIGLLWTQTFLFQRLQRLAHDDISLDEYLETISSFRTRSPRTLCLYSNDAEIFGVRPNRMATEERVANGEWQRIQSAWQALARQPDVRFVSPSEAFGDYANTTAPLHLETSAYPIPVKKQPKYNVLRWALAGRDNLAINAACSRLTDALEEKRVTTDMEWAQLCRLWSSDFRTHITEQRWHAYLNEVAELEAKHGTSPPPPWPPSKSGVQRSDGRWITVETPALKATLNRRRGLAIQSLARHGETAPPMIVSHLHGRFQGIALQYDWYTANLVFEALDGPKVSDLDWAHTSIDHLPDGIIRVTGTMQSRKGPITKAITFDAIKPRVTVDIWADWPEPGRGSLRAAHICVEPTAFEWKDLTARCHNGGHDQESFALGPGPIDHAAAVSFQVSATTGLGCTDGILDISDGRRGFRIEIDRAVAPLIPMIEHRPEVEGPFCRILLSAQETDDTLKPHSDRRPPLHFRYAILLH